MIIGINTSYTHGDEEYHIQCEDLGDQASCFEIKVYKGGTILWQKRVPYAADAAGLGNPAERSAALKRQMEKLVQTVKIAISQNKIGND